MATKTTDLTNDEVIEDIALRLADAIYNNDTRWIRETLVEFAQEIKRQAVEP